MAYKYLSAMDIATLASKMFVVDINSPNSLPSKARIEQAVLAALMMFESSDRMLTAMKAAEKAAEIAKENAGNDEGEIGQE